MSNWKHTIVGVEWDAMKLYEREQAFRAICQEYNITLDQPSLCIAWEDPTEPDAPMKVTVPTATWWAMALHGHILPPVEAYHLLAEDEVKPDFVRHTRGNILHETQLMPPMTPEEAMIYLTQMVIPPRVWRDYRGNREILRIVPREAIPTDRTNRNAWRLAQLEEAA